MQFYLDRKRRDLPHALPDAEVFEAAVGHCWCGEYTGTDEYSTDPCASHPNDAPEIEEGWYWWACFPGCLPDSDPIGPFPNMFRAIRDARRGLA